MAEATEAMEATEATAAMEATEATAAWVRHLIGF